MTIHEKINLKDNIFYYFSWLQARQMIENNRIALAPYYQDRVIKQGRYVNYIESLPEYVRNEWMH